MCYLLRRCLYSKKARSDLSTVLPLTETSGGKPPLLAHSAHVLLSRAEQLNVAPSFPVSRALPNEAWRAVSSPLQPGPRRRIRRKILEQSRSLNLLLICFPPLRFKSVCSIPQPASDCKHNPTNVLLCCLCRPLYGLRYYYTCNLLYAGGFFLKLHASFAVHCAVLRQYLPMCGKISSRTAAVDCGNMQWSKGDDFEKSSHLTPL